MKERPILFSGPMVRAILDGRKTQTRRVITPHTSTINGPTCQRRIWDELDFSNAWVDNSPFSPAGNPGPYLKVPMPCDGTVHRVYPRWFTGDRPWVRETFALIADGPLAICPGIAYRADNAIVWGNDAFLDGRANGKTVFNYEKPDIWRWSPSIHMPRWVSRLSLEVVSVRVERLQEISEEDSMAEGVATLGPLTLGFPSYRVRFGYLWNDLNSRRGFPWKSNPWVWVITFKVLEGLVP